MKRKNLTRNALVTSIISLLLCVSMLVGTTFAWFTDEVVTGMNTIAAGNLDVELLADGNKVDSNTKLFDDVTLWEPGVVVYENLQVANVGTLALKYQMSLNFGNENDLNGHKLSEVLQVAIIDKIGDNATREQVLAAAEAAIAATGKDASLSNFYLTGELEAGDETVEETVVIFWAPNDNAKDNLYNANNGKTTSDGQPLHIEFGVNLQATQKMSENDSFGNDYDESASILPKATVNNVSAKYPSVNATFGIGGAASEVPIDFALQFLPNESEDEGAVSNYKNWHADYVIVADKDVPADSVALAGYYKAWCQYNNDNWVALTGPAVPANQEVRLVAGMLNGTTVSYEEICQYGNDGTGFLCGAADLTGENVGTTITVELRMYEVDETSSSLSTTDSETGCYEVIGKYTYTFGAKSVATVEELNNALASNASEIQLSADLDLVNASLTVANDTVIDLNGHTLSGNTDSSTTSNLIKVAAGAELTLTGNGTVDFKAYKPDTDWDPEGFPTYANNTIRCEGKLIVDGVTIKNSTNPGGASYAIDCYPGADLIVNSGEIDGCGKLAIRLFANSNTVPTNVTINGGTITGKRAIWVQLPSSNIANERLVNLTINGGKLICTNTEEDVCVYSYSYGDSFAKTNVTITGGEFFGDVCFGGGKAKTTQEDVTITGGTFYGELGRYLADDGWEDIAKP